MPNFANNPDRSSWLHVDTHSDFPIQNIPFGVFLTRDDIITIGTRIGNTDIDLGVAEILGRDPIPLEDEEAAAKPKAVTIISEKDCIGGTLCIQACPVDAILGAAKQMHTVIEAECTGCELCIPPCPVECIDMVPIKDTTDTWRWPLPNQNSAEVSHG